jgi:TPP-dependent pyruvate/acetoin dehydrogenase alpha subunit
VPEEQQTTSKRVRREDPPPRPVEQVANRGFLEGADPSKHYVWVNEVNDPTINVGYYKHLGYTISQYDPSEARPTLGYNEYKQGDPIKSMGMVLMECPKERRAELDAVGWDRADRIEETIRKRELDPVMTEEERRGSFRGITSARTGQDDRRRWEF